MIEEIDKLESSETLTKDLFIEILRNSVTVHKGNQAKSAETKPTVKEKLKKDDEDVVWTPEELVQLSKVNLFNGMT